MASQAGGEIVLSIGAIVGHLVLGRREHVAEEIRGRYDGFCVPAAPWVGRDFSLRVAFEARGVLRGDERPRVVAGPRSIDVRHSCFEVHLVAGEHAGTTWVGTARCSDEPVAFDLLLRVVWSVFLLRSDGLLIHACAIRWKGAGHVFPGASGTGKTTLAGKVDDPDDVLTDELVPVRRELDGGWRVYASPFWSGARRGARSLQGWPLAGVAFLRKDRDLCATRLDAAEATRRLLETLLCFEDGAYVARLALETAARLASEVPAVEVSSALQTPFARIVGTVGFSGPRSSPTPSNREAISGIRAILRAATPYALTSKGCTMFPAILPGDTPLV